MVMKNAFLLFLLCKNPFSHQHYHNTTFAPLRTSDGDDEDGMNEHGMPKGLRFNAKVVYYCC
eukprot:gnl/Chilomastix_caulleri/8264.p2 GENE.gnl/Chilomastix_caulleri/8264~~gnl/Chilomastix_caulleri/8264.p2  ORF type:complete len:62 (-),score=1.81 gnl/Chilomastix_caulleri/8264:134-319(-)